MDADIDIKTHEGKKYLTKIRSPDGSQEIEVDVYCVIEAFAVTCPARAHALKKLLCCGARGKGDALADLQGIYAAVCRAIELEQQRVERNGHSKQRVSSKSGRRQKVQAKIS